ncbi:hypothetical protein FB567DRAFT_546309 [Paraphoma chrysanthemicola]|uniref:Uncharacterized protein n=1 Tax=Paraphoma chrysanthemicola TaxID=798071 RepID=A0A8K0W2A4_9PLEO|nr:hypothetical protein FB567DRAFT_546309 [Paraphoma chrysanthemicola]
MATFSGLPVEIRGLIYEHALRNKGRLGIEVAAQVDKRRVDAAYYTRKLPEICFTNKLEREIAISIFIRHIKFVVCCTQRVMLDFLRAFPENIAYKSVRNIEYHYIRSHTSGNYDGLTNLTIAFFPLEIRKFCLFESLSGAEIAEEKNIHAILSCMNLRQVKLEVSLGGRDWTEDIRVGVGGVAAWIREEFAKKGKRDVAVKVTSSAKYSITLRHVSDCLRRAISPSPRRASVEQTKLASWHATTTTKGHSPLGLCFIAAIRPGQNHETESAAGNLDRDLANMHTTSLDYGNSITNGVEEEKLCDTQSRRRINFTDLPVEVKENIYELTLPSNLYYDVRSSALVQKEDPSSFTDPSHLPAICYISSLERKIGLRTFLRTATMIYHDTDIDDMRKCLDQATNNDESSLALVTKLGIFYQKPRDYLDQELQGMVTVVDQFPALRGVTISFTINALQEMHFGLNGVH